MDVTIVYLSGSEEPVPVAMSSQIIAVRIEGPQGVYEISMERDGALELRVIDGAKKLVVVPRAANAIDIESRSL